MAFKDNPFLKTKPNLEVEDDEIRASDPLEKVIEKTPESNEQITKSKKVVKSDKTRSNEIKSDKTRSNEIKSDKTRYKGGQIRPSIGDIIVLNFLVQNERENGLLLYNYASIGIEVGKSYNSVKKAVERLATADLIDRMTPSNTGRGGGAVFKVTAAGQDVWNEYVHIAWAVAKSKKVVKSDKMRPILDDDDDLDSSSGNAEAGNSRIFEIRKIDISSVIRKAKTFSHSKIDQYAPESLKIEAIREILERFVHDQKPMQNPDGYLATCLRKGEYARPENYKSRVERENELTAKSLEEDKVNLVRQKELEKNKALESSKAARAAEFAGNKSQIIADFSTAYPSKLSEFQQAYLSMVEEQPALKRRATLASVEVYVENRIFDLYLEDI